MPKSRGHISIRKCITCGTKRSKDRLIRLVLDEQGRLIRDHCGKMQGRGAYVCKDNLCQEQLSRRKYLNRAFRCMRDISVGSELWIE